MPKVGGFVAELGGAALDLLDPQPGERILDVGCGEGTLTSKIIERGATVLGIDNSPEMIAAARDKGSTRCCSRPRTCSSSPSSTRHSPMPRCTGCSKRAGGASDLPRVEARRALRRRDGRRGQSREAARGARRGADHPRLCAAGRGEQLVRVAGRVRRGLRSAGFDEIDARLIERPTPIEHGVAAWVTTFRRAGSTGPKCPRRERAEIGAAVADRVGSNVADYVRLRFIMRKPA